LQKLGQNFANMERGAPWSPRSLWNIFKKKILVEILGRIPIEFGTKRYKFQLKRMSIQLENDQTISHKNGHSFQSWQ